jgi:hypothetical protein
VNLTLVPFGEPALQHFIFLERPEGMALEGAKGINAPVHEALPSMAEGDIVPQMQDFATIGHLYRSIEQGLALRGRLAEVLATPPPALRRLRRHPRTLIGVATAERRDEPYAWQQSTGAGADHTKTAPDGPQQRRAGARWLQLRLPLRPYAATAPSSRRPVGYGGRFATRKLIAVGGLGPWKGCTLPLPVG